MNEVGIGARIINFLIDTFLVAILGYIFYKWWSFYVFYWKYKYFPFYMFFYATLVVYYTLFELLFSRTPGKWLSISKVRNYSGGRPAFYQIFIRSIVRVILIDAFFIPFLDRPLHDALSKTKVIEA